MINTDDDDDSSTEDRDESPVALENDMIGCVLQVEPKDVPVGTVSMGIGAKLGIWTTAVKTASEGTWSTGGS